MQNRLEWLDELRGIAALLVMLIHYHALIQSPESRPFAVESFARGVQLFYVLSGYILYKLYAEHVGDFVAFSKFLTKRFFRIAPLFYFMTVVGLIAPYQEVPDPVANTIAHILILPFGFFPQYIASVIGIEWSVFVECWFYVLFPLLVVGYKRSPWFFLGAVFALSFMQSSIVYFSGADVATRTHYYAQPTTQLVFFALGMMIADRDCCRKEKTSSALLFSIGIVSLLLTPYAVRSSTAQMYVSLLSIGLIVSSYSGLPRPNWTRTVLAWIGVRSYSLYLIHVPLLMLSDYFFPFRGTGVTVWMGQLAFAFFVATITWHLIELPGIRIGKRLLAVLNGQKVVSIAPPKV